MAKAQWIETAQVTIANGAAISSVYNNTEGKKLLGVRIGSGWTTANLTIQGDFDANGIYADVGAAAQDGTALTLTGAANKYYPLPTPVRAFKFKVTSSANQGAARTITLVFERQY